MTVGGIPATFDPQTGAWSVASVPLSNVGANSIVTRAVDNAGNVATKTTNVTREPPADTQEPRVSITSPANNSTTIETFVNVAGTASDAGQYQSGVGSVTVNGVAATYDAATGRGAQNVPFAPARNHHGHAVNRGNQRPLDQRQRMSRPTKPRHPLLRFHQTTRERRRAARHRDVSDERESLRRVRVTSTARGRVA